MRRRAAGGGDGDVVAGAGADDQHVAGVLAGDALVDGLVDRVADGGDLQPGRDAVDLGDEAALAADRDRCAPCSRASTWCRPRPTRRRGTRGRATSGTTVEHDAGRRGAGRSATTRPTAAIEPHTIGIGLDEGEEREAGDAEQAADEVELVGVEVGEALERAGDAVADARHHGGDDDEDHRQHDPARRAGRVEAEEDERCRRRCRPSPRGHGRAR